MRSGRLFAKLLAFGLVFYVACWHNIGRAVAEGAPTAISCDSLKVALSGDKNYYIFSATASGAISSITGYTFNYGDHTSYTFTFNPTNDQDHSTATVTHTYQKNGKYKVTVHVNGKAQGKKVSVSSPACHTSVAIPPPGTTLPDTGVTNAITVFVSTVVISTLVHTIWLKRHLQVALRMQ